MGYAGNCQMDGWIEGCWNPSTGKCNTCGQGGTVPLGGYNCFNTGQSNISNGGGVNCSVPYGQVPGGSNDCVSAGGNGGYSTNSDQRLKREITPIALTGNGIQLYSFKYLWSDEVYVGVMAQDLLKNSQWKEAVIKKQNGFYAVNYNMLGLEMVTLDQYQQKQAVAVAK
jgi:hypothetical protein